MENVKINIYSKFLYLKNKLTYKNFELDLSKGILVSGDKKLEITKNEIKSKNI